MKRRTIRAVISMLCAGAPCMAAAAIIVDPPRPITHRVTVQMIQTALDNGSSPATVFGDAVQRAEIEAGIDMIWAQAGIDIDFLPTITRYNNTFAYQGNGGTRPTEDLRRITSTATAVMNPTPSVINMFFVHIVPGFDFTGAWAVNGIGSVGEDGIAQFVGDNQLAFNRDAVARVVAHEIGHNLGLFHAPAGGPNLMSPQATTSQLTAEQISAVFQTTFRYDSVAYIPQGGTGFPQPIPNPMDLPGDYNDDGSVDMADFIVWRNSVGSTTNLAADGNGNGIVDSGDYTLWRSRFGTTGGGAGLTASVPEPITSANAAAAIMLWSVCAARRRRSS